MSFKIEGRTGSQKPRVSIVPAYKYTDGDDAADLATSYGLTPDKWQKDILKAWLGRDEHDKYTSYTCGLAVPRQNGKNGVLEMRELYGLAIIGETILHTAHEVKTARKAFLRLCSFFENTRDYPELAELVICIRKTNGQEAIELTNGGKIEFSARSKSAGRGFTADVLVLDECQELTDEQYAALLPTISSSPLDNRQIIQMGTPPDPQSTIAATVFPRTRNAALKGLDSRLSWHEWSVEEVGDIHDKKRWFDCNPALGIRLSLEAVETESVQLDEEQFARERLGYWRASLHKVLFDEDKWNKLATTEPPEGRIGYGVKFSPDGELVALTVAVKPKEGAIHVELIERKHACEGIDWLSDWLVERKSKCCCVVIDGRSNADTLYADLITKGMPKKAIVMAGTSGVVKAATRFFNTYNEKKISHYNQKALNEAVTHSRKRPIGRDGGWAFGAIEGVDITPLESCSLALWGVVTSKRHPGRKVRIL